MSFHSANNLTELIDVKYSLYHTHLKVMLPLNLVTAKFLLKLITKCILILNLFNSLNTVKI